jgi:hypothetical protein
VGSKADFNNLEWRGLKAIVRAQLIDTARRQKTVSYTDVEKKVNDPRLRSKSEAMDELLGEISGDEHKAGRPLLSAIVVRKDKSLPIPGPGFYKLAKALGSMVQGDTKESFWKAELLRVNMCDWK